MMSLDRGSLPRWWPLRQDWGMQLLSSAASSKTSPQSSLGDCDPALMCKWEHSVWERSLWDAGGQKRQVTPALENMALIWAPRGWSPPMLGEELVANLAWSSSDSVLYVQRWGCPQILSCPSLCMLPSVWALSACGCIWFAGCWDIKVPICLFDWIVKCLAQAIRIASNQNPYSCYEIL